MEPAVTALHTIDMPGRFASWFAECGIVNGEAETQDERNLYARWCDRFVIQRGRGYTVRLDGLTTGAVADLHEYAGYCLAANADEPIQAERAAAERVRGKCEAVLVAAGWRWHGGGWNP